MESTDMNWRKASYSNGGENCVEVGNSRGTLLVRDTTDRDGGTLKFSVSSWKAFAGVIKNS